MVPLILAYWLTQPVPSYGAADNGPAFPSSHTDSILRCERPKESPFKRLAMPYSHSQRLSEMTEERSTPLSCTVYECIIAHAILPVKPFFYISAQKILDMARSFASQSCIRSHDRKQFSGCAQLQNPQRVL